MVVLADVTVCDRYSYAAPAPYKPYNDRAGYDRQEQAYTGSAYETPAPAAYSSSSSNGQYSSSQYSGSGYNASTYAAYGY